MKILSLALVLCLSACGPSTIPPEVPNWHLVILFDVSTSLTLDNIKAEADIAFRFIENQTAFPSGQFEMYVADRDVEQGLILRGQKDLYDNQQREEQQIARLNKQRDQLKGTLESYCKRNPSRNKTCLIKVFRSVQRLAGSGNARQRVLIISDMLEDCSAVGDPRNAAELRNHIQHSVKDSPIPDLHGLEVFAAIVASPLDIDTLITVWGQTLGPTTVRLSLGSIDTLLRNLPKS